MNATLPELTGSPNQIERANRYREMTAKAIAATAAKTIAALNRDGHADLAARISEASEKLLAQTDAAWWIGHEPKTNTYHSALAVAERVILDSVKDLDEAQADAIRDAMDD
jgi:hypothetical protein